MQNVLTITHELNRLKALLSYQILDTPNEIEFDDLVKVVATIYNAPAAAVTFIDENRQWIKASVGLQVCETDRREAVCNYTIRQSTINEIKDMRTDKRFRNFPYVAGDPFFRFYAGIPLVTENEYAIGALCVMDTTARTLNEDEKKLLSDLGSVVMTQIEISLKRKELEKITHLQRRIAYLMTREEQSTAVNPKSESPQEEHGGHVLSVNELVTLDELLMQQAGCVTALLNERVEWRNQELQNAIACIKNDQLRQMVSSGLNMTSVVHS
jgi:GAF domain-containing protein